MLSLNDWLYYLEQLPKGLSTANRSHLENIKKVASFLKLDSFSSLVVIIAGTNGKGSCVAYLDNIWREAGYTVGAYTSPHLLRYNERICVNGIPAEDSTILKAFALIDSACKQLSIILNYFEFTTLAAFSIFKSSKLDVLLLEVGLGGRFDPVNIISPDVSVITTISLDHVEYLGDDRNKIGREKAGVMRIGIPVICGDNNPPESIYDCAQQIGAPLFCLHQNFEIKINQRDWEWCFGNKRIRDLPMPKLPLQNAATSLMVVELLQERLPVTQEKLTQGIKKAFLLGRFQWLKFSNNVKCIVDVAHNGESASLLATNLQANPCKGKTFAVFSMLKDKDATAILKPFLGLVDEWSVCELQIPRAANLEQLRKAFLSLDFKNVTYFSSIELSFKNVLKKCTLDDRIVVFGSFYIVAEVLHEHDLNWR